MFRRLLRSAWGTVALSAWFVGAIVRERDLEDGVLLTGSPRSGTTWCVELLELVPEVRRLWEPFGIHPEEGAAGVNFGLGWRPMVPRGATAHDVAQFLADIFGDRRAYAPAITARPSLPPVAHLGRLLFGRRTVVKATRAQRLLPWIASRVPIKTILLMRHPCAVVASQLHHRAWDDLTSDRITPAASATVAAEYADLASFVSGLETRAELLAAVWSFDYLVPFDRAEECERTTLVLYEDLVRNLETQMVRLADFLDLDVPVERALQVSSRPSSTTVSDSNVATGGDPLATWRNRLTQEQVRRILAVTHRFGLDMYGRGLEPDRSALPTFGPRPADRVDKSSSGRPRLSEKAAET